jgi:biopolymer transport protein ExbD
VYLVSLNEAILELNNNGPSVILSADAAALHVWVINIMDILNKNGSNEVQIRTIEQ